MFAFLSDILTSIPGLLLWVTFLPLLVAGLLFFAETRRELIRLAPWSALPALVVSIVAPTGLVENYDWLLLGARFELDVLGRVFLFFTSGVWLAAGVFAQRSRAARLYPLHFWAFFSLTMAGNIGVALARDLPSFLFAFTLMGISSYGLVVHRRDGGAIRAGRIYLTLLIIGEGLLYAAAVLAAKDASSYLAVDIARAVAAGPNRDLIVALFLVGFGLKAGFVPLHISLPPAYEAAPISAAAVLSAAMSKAGVLGWALFLPLGFVKFPLFGWIFLFGGLFAAFYGVGVGLFQRDPKALLAYSSISQIGYMTTLVGVGLLLPALWVEALVALAIYALHHGVNKGALFLSVRITRGGLPEGWPRRLVQAGLIVPALALVGAPLTTGAVAKFALKETVHGGDWPIGSWFGWALGFGAVGTGLLLVRFLYMIWPRRRREGDAPPERLQRGQWLSWSILVVAGLVVPWLYPWQAMQVAATRTLDWSKLLTDMWPIAVTALLVAAAVRFGPRAARIRKLRIPPGDLLIPALCAIRRVQLFVDRAAVRTDARWRRLLALQEDLIAHRERASERLTLMEAPMQAWHVGAMLLVALLVFLFVLAWLA